MTNSKRIIRRILKNILKAIILLLVIYNIVYVIGKEYNEEFNIKLFGIQSVIITERAMEPELKKNDIAIIKNSKEIKEGDIVAFYKDNTLKIRRIYRVNNIDYITKGDNYLYVDADEISKEQIEGKVINKIRYMRIFLKILQSKGLLIFNTIILVIIFLLNRRVNIKRSKRKNKKVNYQNNLK